MSQLTNYAENKVADFFRGQGLTMPTNWFVGLGSAASDASFTELAGSGYARQPYERSLANWAGTQGAGTTLASTGTSHATSNNAAIGFGNPAAAWGTANYVGLFDALSGGNCWFWLPLHTPIVITTGSPNPVEIASGILKLRFGGVGVTDYLSNKMVDLMLRAEAFTWPTTLYNSLFSTAPTNAGGGTEISASGYARAALVPSLSTLSGTQSVGSTSASSGTSGRISNNGAVAFSAFTATLAATGVHDASAAGNLLFWASLPVPISVSASGTPPTFAADALAITVA